MKYNDENLDRSAMEILPEGKRSSFSWRSFLPVFALFVVVYLLLWYVSYSDFDLSTSSYIEYTMSLREIVFICNGLDMEYFILPASILTTWVLIKLKLLKLIRFLFDAIFISSYSESKILIYLSFLALFFVISIFYGIISTCYIASMKKKNAENASEPYVMNVDLKHYPKFHLKSRVAFVKIFENSYSYDEYFSSLQNTQNKKISLVVRDGSRGLPVIDAYKIIYNSDESVKLDMPTTVEEFYNGVKYEEKEADKGLTDDINEMNRKIEQEAGSNNNRPVSNFGNYFKKRMPDISSKEAARVIVSCYVTEEGDVTNAEITTSISPAADKALLKAVKDMGKWKGKPIDGAASVTIEIDYANGTAHYMFVDVKISDTKRRYRDCYGLNEYGSFYTERIDIG